MAKTKEERCKLIRILFHKVAVNLAAFFSALSDLKLTQKFFLDVTWNEILFSIRMAMVNDTEIV